MPATPAISKEAINNVIYHVFLPPQVPQAAEENDEITLLNELTLLKMLHDALSSFSDHVSPDEAPAVDKAREAVIQLDNLKDLSPGNLQNEFHKICKDGGYLPIHVHAQNAAILLSRESKAIIFEFFELAPTNQAVMSTQGRLRRRFPASAISLPLSVFNDDDYHAALAAAINTMNRQQVAEMKPRARKSGHDQIEERDTTDPSMVTDFLATFLLAKGEVVQVPVLTKNTREQINWHNARLPWRRSPSWLLTRVIIHMILSRHHGDALYKQFMVFFMAQVLAAALPRSPPREVIYCMVAKISGRLQKMERDASKPWLQSVEKIVAAAVLSIKQSWNATIQKADPSQDMKIIASKSLHRDTCIKLPALDEFIESLGFRQSSVNDGSFTPTWSVPQWKSTTLPPAVFSQTGDGALVDLFAFEDWVATYLDTWILVNLSKKTTPAALFELMQAYHSSALNNYRGSPGAISLMVLTTLELWVACDKSVCETHPLLSKYTHQIPIDLLQSLILPFKFQMERLHRVETYMQGRHSAAVLEATPSIFHSFGEQKSFGVQFYLSSTHHKSLKTTIEIRAAGERQAKKTEFEQKKEKYTDLMNQSKQLECDFYTGYNRRTGFQFTKHDRNCRKCRLQNQAEDMDIAVHEWPLPDATNLAQNVVFELRVPHAFGTWRDATAFVILDVLRFEQPGSAEKAPREYLHSYLDRDFTYSSPSCQFILASTTKSNQRTHRKVKTLRTSSEKGILLKNGLNYRYYDKIASKWVGSFTETQILPTECTYKLSKSYSSLRPFIFRPHQSPNGKTANHAISQQSHCPEHLSLEEFKALAVLPCGYRIQWHNILTQLHMPIINFTSPDVVLILLQVSQQAGPPSETGTYRSGHWPLNDEAFALAFLKGLDTLLERTSENWEGYHALKCLIALAARLLSLSPTAAVSSECIKFLAACRQVAMNWLGLLQERVKNSESEELRTALLSNVFSIAQICITSFDVEECHLKNILEPSSHAAVLLQSSIIAFDATAKKSRSDADSIRLRRTLFKAFRLLKASIASRNSPSLDMALRKTWAGYPGSAAWSTVSSKHDHWLVTSTSASEKDIPMCVQYNLLTGELLVNGLPLSRLPTPYEQHPTYAELFGKAALEILPTNMPGMAFSSKNMHHGYALYFCLSDNMNRDMLVVAKSDSKLYDLIPARVFTHALPDKFVHKYVHWYSRSSQTIEFRDKNAAWRTSPKSNWILRREESGWTLERNDEQVLIGTQTESAKYLSNLLKPLEEELHLHLIRDKKSGSVAIEMPRLKLDFYLEPDSTEVQSRQFRGMYIDSTTRIDCFIGLVSKIVLKNDAGQRKVLIPDGDPTWSWDATTNHTRVSIPAGASHKVHLYELDTLLHRLVDNGSLQSKLVICYLHALTSSCLPDGLTGRTGTEQALFLLRSAALRSFECLSSWDILRLQRIGKLSPGREFYPQELQCMESITWDKELGALSQDNAFYEEVQAIFSQASATALFYPSSCSELPELDHVNPSLGKRQSIRASNFQTYGFGAENRSIEHDATYESRDSFRLSIRSERVLKIAHMLFRPQTELLVALSSNPANTLWDFLHGTVIGPSGGMTTKDLGYDAKWLEEQRDILQRYWCQLHQLFVRPSQINLFQLLLFLSTLAYANSGNLSILQILVAIFKSNAASKNEQGSSIMALKKIQVPPASHFSLPEGRTVVRSYLENTVEQNGYDFVDCPEFNLPRNEDETDEEFHERRRNLFATRRQSVISHFVHSMESLWLCETPDLDESAVYFNTRSSVTTIQKRWKSWFQNHCFYEYLFNITAALKSCSVAEAPLPTISAAAPPIWRTRNSKPYISTADLFSFSNFLLPCVQENTMNLCKPLVSAVSGTKLEALLKKLNTTADSQQPYTQKYVVELEKSLEALKRRSVLSTSTLPICSMREPLADNLQRCQDDVDDIYSALQVAICTNLQQKYGAELTSSCDLKVLATFMAPRMSVSIMVGNLAMAPWRRLSESWKKAIVLLGIAITKLQQASRLVRMTAPTDMIQELSNSGHSNWSPLDSPESLLLEIESGILIREVQEEIASQMRDRPSGENAVMQLNMGEGKSSVIVPMVAAHLADGDKLVRAIVAKPQAKELFRTLVLKLGGLLNRRIYHMPFNRSLRLGSHQVRALANLYKQCREQGGVVLCQPEHLLSFKLMAIEYQSLEDRKDQGTALLDLYHDFESCARDIVDESDENFSPKFELIYTMGAQRPIELSPERWTTLQRVLRIVASIVISMQKQAPDSVEVTHSAPGRFPRTRILRNDAGTLLLRRLTQQICNTGLPGLPIARQDENMRAAIFDYVFSDELSQDQISAVEKSSLFTEAIKGPLLIIRGLIAGRVLLFALKQKRWRVNYGLDGSRTPNTKLAVPYRAKDCPSPRSEFSHPDVVIILTCLSYYYEGLSDEELLAAFDHLMRSDQADIEYQEWVKDAPDLAGAFHRLGGVNIKDIDQVTQQVFPPLRYAKGTIDYFLSHLVFPKEMKEFSHKLSASGWDLGQQTRYPTTGFSGTNDSRHVLPLDVKQLDIEAQIHTSALVLENLLREENTVHLLKPSAHGTPEGQDESSFIDNLFRFVADIENRIHVILDVGAQVLELTNVQVAMRWLKLLPEGHKQEAVVYFNDSDDICVIDRKGTVESLWISPYGDQLDRCLVFLDQAHTRGTDLKLPVYYRAAVTLGPDLTKDGLVQACMRMRKLGSGQSVVFCLSQEMQYRVNQEVGNASNDEITVDDVLRWSIYETHAELHRVMPLWAMQGSRFERQKEIWAKAKTPSGIKMSQDQAEEFLEEEAQTIEYRYRPTAHNAAEELGSQFGRLRLDEENEALAAIYSRCEDFGVSNCRSAVLQEEQEKELAPEVEQERAVERPEPAAPERHEIHPDLITFIRDGIIWGWYTAFSPAFLALSDTSVADTSNLTQFPGSLLATADFARTVKLNASQKKLPGARDSYQRPIQWVLTSRCTMAGMRAVIISPHEAHELIPQIMQSKAVNLHLYAPRANLAFKPLDVLKLYTMPKLPENWKLPDHLRLQLNLFAGQLYFSSYEDYKSSCEMLSLAWGPPSGDVVVEADGFIPLASAEPGAGNARRATFSKSPVKSIKILLMVLRHDCQEIDKTHWGRTLAGELLTEEDFEEAE